MKPGIFEELLESVREGGEILHGKRKASRRFDVGSSDRFRVRNRHPSATIAALPIAVRTKPDRDLIG